MLSFTQLVRSLADGIEIFDGHELLPASGSAFRLLTTQGAVIQMMSAETVSGRENIFLLYYSGYDCELFFFQTACMVLCFRIVTKTGLITYQCFSCC